MKIHSQLEGAYIRHVSPLAISRCANANLMSNIP